MSSVEEQKDAFLDAIEEDPYDLATHRAYADFLYENGMDDEALIQAEWTPEAQKAAEEYVKRFAEECSQTEDSPYGGTKETTVTEVMDAAHDALNRLLRNDEDREYRYYAGVHLPFDTPEIAYRSRMAEFWKHFKVLTGRPVPEDCKETFVSCGC